MLASSAGQAAVSFNNLVFLNDILAREYKICLPFLATYSAGAPRFDFMERSRQVAREPLTDNADYSPTA